MPDADPLVAEDVRDELEGLLHLELEVLFGERQLGRRQLRLAIDGISSASIRIARWAYEPTSMSLPCWRS